MGKAKEPGIKWADAQPRELRGLLKPPIESRRIWHPHPGAVAAKAKEISEKTRVVPLYGRGGVKENKG